MAAAGFTDANIKRELLECPVCQETYNDTDRIPRLLSCRHPYCSKCLYKLLQAGTIKCPVCPELHQVINDDITTIPKDLTLGRLVDMLKDKECIQCDGCDENDAAAVCYCETCQEHYCTNCAAAHKRVKVTKLHPLRDIIPNKEDGSKQNGQYTCTDHTHKEQVLNLYCEICHKLVCSECKHTTHLNHSISNIGVVFRQKQEELSNLIANIEQVNIVSHVQKLNKRKTELEKNSKQLKYSINEQFEEYITTIRTKCQRIKEEADKKTETKVEDIRQISHKLEDQKENLNSKLSEARTLVQCKDKVAFINGYKAIADALNEVQNIIMSSENVSDLLFVQACTLDDFDKIIDALGTVEDSEHAYGLAESSSNVRRELTSTDNCQNESSIRSLNSGHFLDTLKSLLRSEHAVHNEVSTTSGGFTPNMKYMCANTEVNQELTMGNLKSVDHDVPFKTVKECLPHGKLDIINTLTVRLMVKMRFETLKLKGQWVIEGDMLIVESTTLDEAEMCMEIIVETVLEETVPLPVGSELIVDTDKWQIVNNRLNHKYKDQVKVEVLYPQNVVGIYATCTSALKDACDHVRIFLRDNLIKLVSLEYQTHVVQFVMRHKNRLQKIRDINSEYFVSIASLDNNSILVKGIGFGLCRAVKMVHSLACKVRGHGEDVDDEERFDSGNEDNDDNDDDNDDDDDRFSDDESTAEETTHEAAVAGVDVNITLMLAGTCVPVKSLCLPGDDRIIYAVVGDITTLPVEAVVNPANQLLKHNGGVSKILVEKGGASIQEECRNHISRNGNMRVGDIYSSGAGTLPFSTIIHAVGPKWIDGNHREREELSALVIKCLQEVSKQRLASVALPAIGTGANKFPHGEACDVIVNAIREFLTQHPRTSICELYFCHIDADLVDGFSRSVCRGFNDGDIVTSNTQSATSASASTANITEAVSRNFIC